MSYIMNYYGEEDLRIYKLFLLLVKDPHSLLRLISITISIMYTNYSNV